MLFLPGPALHLKDALKGQVEKIVASHVVERVFRWDVGQPPHAKPPPPWNKECLMSFSDMLCGATSKI